MYYFTLITYSNPPIIIVWKGSIDLYKYSFAVVATFREVSTISVFIIQIMNNYTPSQ